MRQNKKKKIQDAIMINKCILFSRRRQIDGLTVHKKYKKIKEREREMKTKTKQTKINTNFYLVAIPFIFCNYSK